MLKGVIVLNAAKIIILIIFAALFMDGVVSASTIHGTIYDLVLNKESNVVVEINTLPKQMMISKDGEYSFNVPIGNYSLYAYTRDSYAQENITVDTDGDYLIDLVLEIGIEKPENLDVGFSEPNTDLIGVQANNYNSMPIIVGIIFLVLVILLVILWIKDKKKRYYARVDKDIETPEITETSPLNNAAPEDEYEAKILSIIRDNTRITQKDLRKQIPLSEGKISLIVSDLEHQEKIKKIKKGRGNILIYLNK